MTTKSKKTTAKKAPKKAPKKVKKTAAKKVATKSQIKHCGLCEKRGHNARTCKTWA